MARRSRRAQLKRNVARGAELLDKHEPGWYERVVETDLDMQSCVCCVAGQVMESAWRRCDLPPAVKSFSARYGFDVCDADSEELVQPWDVLEELWLEEIERRKEGAKAMDIGKEEKTHTVEPIENPVPEKVPERQPTRVPRKEPVRTPEKTPEKVPAR